MSNVRLELRSGSSNSSLVGGGPAAVSDLSDLGLVPLGEGDVGPPLHRGQRP